MSQNVKRFFAVTLVVLLAGLVVMPVLSSRAANRERREQRDKVSGEWRENFTSRRKLAIELEEQIEQEAMRPAKKKNKLQRVIIKLRDNRSEGEQLMLQTASEEFRAQILQSKSDANEMRATALSARVEELNGRFGAAYNRLGMMSVEMPLAKLKELENDPDIAFISLDLPVSSTAEGHVESTAGAAPIRTYVSGTALDGRGIGVAVLDSGIDKTHNLLKASIGHPGVTYERDFTGANDPKDYYGPSSHVATLVAGCNAEGGYYEGIGFICEEDYQARFLKALTGC